MQALVAPVFSIRAFQNPQSIPRVVPAWLPLAKCRDGSITVKCAVRDEKIGRAAAWKRAVYG
ncbi:hypothetical protein GCM10008941_25780 [Rhizomicrobium palustre]